MQEIIHVGARTILDPGIPPPIPGSNPRLHLFQEVVQVSPPHFNRKSCSFQLSRVSLAIPRPFSSSPMILESFTNRHSSTAWLPATPAARLHLILSIFPSQPRGCFRHLRLCGILRKPKDAIPVADMPENGDAHGKVIQKLAMRKKVMIDYRQKIQKISFFQLPNIGKKTLRDDILQRSLEQLSDCTGLRDHQMALSKVWVFPCHLQI